MNLVGGRPDQGQYANQLSSPAMRHVLKAAALTAAFFLQSVGAFAAEPVKRIAIYVQPYYQAADSADEQPQVAIGESLSGLLRSNRREDILAARDSIVVQPKLVTPMSLMVLAIRLYDAGLRDDAVFWFYVAKDRFVTLADVVDIAASGLAQVEDAVRSFATLAGPVINGYAFCDLAKQRELRAKALAWVEQNPYQAMFMDRLTAKPGDRAANLKLAIRTVHLNVDKEQAYFADPKHVDEFYATRKRNDADVKFCWK
jgi:hypothetical protein